VSLSPMVLAEIDDAEAAATARIIAKVKRIVYEDVIWDQIILKEPIHRWSTAIPLLRKSQSSTFRSDSPYARHHSHT